MGKNHRPFQVVVYHIQIRNSCTQIWVHFRLTLQAECQRFIKDVVMARPLGQILLQGLLSRTALLDAIAEAVPAEPLKDRLFLLSHHLSSKGCQPQTA